MTRGIHLKQLTNTDLGLLGLQANPSENEGSPPDTENQLTAKTARVLGPPQNPKTRPQIDQAEGTGPGWNHPDIDLAALTREIRLGLEDTLRFLDCDRPARDDPPQMG